MFFPGDEGETMGFSYLTGLSRKKHIIFNGERSYKLMGFLAKLMHNLYTPKTAIHPNKSRIGLGYGKCERVGTHI
jgi:hypothetical protein